MREEVNNEKDVGALDGRLVVLAAGLDVALSCQPRYLELHATQRSEIRPTHVTHMAHVCHVMPSAYAVCVFVSAILYEQRDVVCVCACARARARVHIHTYMHTHVCMHMQIYAYIYMHTYIYAYTCYRAPALAHRVSRRGAQGQ